MQFEWDIEKRARNLTKHGVDFAVAPRLWHAPLLVTQDTRHDYQEPRWCALGRLDGRVMVVVYTERPNHTVRIISCRKANQREVRCYEKYTHT